MITTEKNLRVVYRKTSRFHDIKVVDRDNQRLLLTGTGRARKQSCVNLRNLRDHVLDYSALLFSSLLFVPNPIRALVLGLGAGVVPRELIHYIARVKVDVIEIDPEIVLIAKKYFFLKEGDRLSVIVGDGREVINRSLAPANRSYDIIVLDAFLGDYVPGNLMTIEFLHAVHKLLSRSGVVAANMFNAHPLFPHQVKTFREVFGDQLYSLTGKRSPSTTVVFAPAHETPVPDKQGGHSPDEIARRSGLSFALAKPDRMQFTGNLAQGKVLSDKDIAVKI